MAFWKNMWGFVSGSSGRQKGVQSPIPPYPFSSPVAVTLDSALQLSSVWACVRLIAECVGSLDICVYKIDPSTGERVEDDEHYLSKLFSGKVNRWQTRQEFMETMTYQLVLMGNCYAMKQKDSKGNLIGLIPLMSQQMQVDLLDDGTVIYSYNEGTNVKVFSAESIWHNKLFGNGVIGLSPLAFARNSIGIGQAAEGSVTKIYKNGGKPSGVLTIDKILTEAQRKQIKESFSELSEGNSDRLFVLEADMKYTQVSLSPLDIELLASRRFQIEDIARFFGVPSVLINDTSAGTTWGSGIQQIVQGFYKLNLRPYLERYESSMEVNLLTPAERASYEIEFDFDDLLQPEQSERIKSYKEAVTGGIMTPNEARLEEGWKPKTGGDSLLVQQQMWPLEKITDPKRVESGGASNANTKQ